MCDSATQYFFFIRPLSPPPYLSLSIHHTRHQFLQGFKLILPLEEALKATQDIQAEHHIQNIHSKDIQDALTAAREAGRK